jgi:hypothetical protein
LAIDEGLEATNPRFAMENEDEDEGEDDDDGEDDFVDNEY